MQFANLRTLLRALGSAPCSPCDADPLLSALSPAAVEHLECRRLLSGGPGPGHSDDFGAHNGPPAQHVELHHRHESGRSTGRDDAANHDANDDHGVDANNQNDNQDDDQQDNGALVVKKPSFYEFYVGPKRADLNVVAASAVVKPGKGLVLTGIMQGKINQRPATSADDSFYVFGINRGSAKAVTPFFGRDKITFDAVVVVSVTHDNGISASVRDLASGAATTLSAKSVKIDGAKVRVTLDPTLLPTPTGGVPLNQYTFNLWPRSSLANPPASPTHDSFVASFVPENAMAPVVVRGNQGGHG